MTRTILLIFFVACQTQHSPDARPQATPKIFIAATTPSLVSLARQLTDGLATVEFLTAPHQGATPKHNPIAAQDPLAKYRLIVAQGARFEPWLTTLSSRTPTVDVLETAKGLDLITTSTLPHHGTHAPKHASAPMPYLWLDPLLYLAQAQAIHRHLLRQYPAWRERLDQNLGEIRKTLLTAHEDAARQLKNLPSRTWLSNDHAFDYFARRYHLDITPLDITPTDAVDAPVIDELGAFAVTHPNTHTLIWSQKPSQRTTASIPTSWSHLTLDPINTPDNNEYLWLKRFQKNVASLSTALANP